MKIELISLWRLLNNLGKQINNVSPTAGRQEEHGESHPCQKEEAARHALRELHRQNNEIKSLEMALSQLLVDRERRWKKTRLKTIAKKYLLLKNKLKNDQWDRESRALVRYFSSSQESDAVVAREMLLPYQVEYQTKMPTVPNFNGATMGAFGKAGHHIGRGNPSEGGIQNDRKPQVQ